MFFYLLLTTLSSVAGAISGIGGGVIIKPVLDLTSTLDTASINFLSSCTVFFMSLVALSKSLLAKQTIALRENTILTFGSIIGGLAGRLLFQRFLFCCASASDAKFIQSLLLFLTTLAVFLYFCLHLDKYSFRLKSFPLIFFTGLLLGTISVFLGIGGGPLNLAVLSFFFSMPKERIALHSIYIIFFSQLSSFGVSYMQKELPFIPLHILLPMIIGGIVGGYLGTHIRLKLPAQAPPKIFQIVLITILLINLYNIFCFYSLSTFA